MKRLLLILTLFPFILNAQTDIYVNILTFDNHGQRLPNCELEILTPGDTASIKLITNENGSVTTLYNVKNEKALIVGQHKDYYTTKVYLKQLSSVDKKDTIFTTLTFEPMQSILHGFTKIDFDTTYAIGEIADLKDTIKIMTDFKQIDPKQNYTKLTKEKSNLYEMQFWRMQNGGLVDPAMYKDNLRIKWKGNDEIKLKFNKKKKRYFIKGIKTVDGLYYELIKK